MMLKSWTFFTKCWVVIRYLDEIMLFSNTYYGTAIRGIILKYFISLLFLLQLLPNVVCAGEDDDIVVLHEENPQIDLGAYLRYQLTDDQVQLSDMKGASATWQANPIPKVLGENQSLWGKVKVRYEMLEKARYTLIINNPNLNFVDIFILDDLGRIVHSTNIGANRPFRNRPFNYREFALPFELDYGQTFNILFRIKDDGPLVFNVNLWKSTALIKQETRNLALIGAFTGALLILGAYFLVTYLMLDSPVRFWFAVANLVFLILFLNNEGVIGQVTGFTSYIVPFSLGLVALSVYCAVKVSYAMLIGMPGYWRLVNYLCAIAFVVIAFWPDAYFQIVMAAGLGGAVILLQLFLAIVYRNPFNSLPNKVYIAGWLTISLTVLSQTIIFIDGQVFDTGSNLLFNLLILMGVVSIAVAVEAHEKVLIHRQYEQQKSTIADLQRFYDFFRNSAEGLFSTTQDGQLISVNPAMCHLFGYRNERHLLQEVRNAAQFYANKEDRDIIVGQLIKEGSCIEKEVKGIRFDGTEFWFSISVQMREDDGNKLLFGSIVDITERKQSDISLRYMATHDSLTGIYNRRHFEGQLTGALSTMAAEPQDLTLLYLDLDQFKIVNDSCGHKAGDVLIKQLAQKLNDVVMNRGILGRMGGDEFAVLLRGDEAVSGYTVAKKLLNAVQEYRFIWDNRMFTLGVSIGFVEYREGINSAEQLMSMADSACYLAKQQGRNQIHVYSSEDAKMQRYEADLESITLINEALQENRFILYYQHYLPLQKGRHGHQYEILLRMADKNGEVIPPAAFLPAAERYNLSTKIDKWVVEHFLRWLSENPEHLTQLSQANINLCGLSMGDRDLKLYFLNAFEKYKIPYEKICFEITETTAIVKMDESLDFINTFRRLGCKFALDDFGIGFSSYEHLKKLPVDYVKIDGSFVKDILVDPIDMAMVCSMKDVAKAMGISTVAEYVESSEIMVELGKIGVDFAQGYGVAKPEALNHFKSYNEET